MSATVERVTFAGSQGDTLAARLDVPAGAVRATANSTRIGPNDGLGRTPSTLNASGALAARGRAWEHWRAAHARRG